MAVKELTVTGTLSETDLGNFGKLKQLRMLDLSGAEIKEIPYNFCGLKTTNTVATDNSYDQRTNIGFSVLEDLKLPALDSIDGFAFAKSRKLKTISMPKVLSINAYAFDCLGATNIKLPDGLLKIGDCAFRYSSIEDLNLPESLYEIGNSAFVSSSLRSVKLPQKIESIPVGCFRYCASLDSIVLPYNVKEIESRAFSNSSIKAVYMPGVTTIDGNAFSACTSLERAYFPNVVSIGQAAFSGCSALEEIDFPSSFASFEGYADYSQNPLSNCTALKSVTCRAVTPPFHTRNTDPITNIDLTNVTLYVPSMSIDTYRASYEWKGFYTVKPIKEDVKDAAIYRDMVVDDGSGISDGCNFLISGKKYNGNNPIKLGALTYTGSQTINMGNYVQNQNLRWLERVLYSSSYFYYNTSLVAEGPITAEKVTTTMWTKGSDIWHFISFPYNIKVSDITTNVDCQWVIREYSGKNRALANGSPTWIELTEDSVMHAYKGYILRCNAETGALFTFPAANDESKNNMFASNDVVKPLEECPSDSANNRSWNLIGNPYPCWYDTRYIDIEAPITVWNDTQGVYEAYSLIDDTLIIAPTTALFVQKPVDNKSITFQREGRQTTSEPRTTAQSKAKAPYTDNRKLYDLVISDDKSHSRTRFVFNDKATDSYEFDKDASLMVPSQITTPLLYTVNDGIRYAINERPIHDGKIDVGLYAPVEGRYSLKPSRGDWADVSLTDYESNATISFSKEYRFRAKQGWNDHIFTISFENVTGISDTKSDATGNSPFYVYTIDGNFVGTLSPNEINELHKGVYVIKNRQTTNKIIVH